MATTQKGSRSITTVLFALGVGACFIGFGGQEIYTGIRNKKVTKMTFKDYVANPPVAEWLMLTDCRFDFDEVAIEEEEKSGKITKIFIPLRPLDDEPTEYPVLLSIDNKDFIAFYSDLPIKPDDESQEVQKRYEAQLDSHLNRYSQWYEATEFSGILEFGLGSDSTQRKELAKIIPNLTADFALIDLGQKPFTVFGIVMVALGVIIVFFGLRRPRIK